MLPPFLYLQIKNSSLLRESTLWRTIPALWDPTVRSRHVANGARPPSLHNTCLTPLMAFTACWARQPEPQCLCLSLFISWGAGARCHKPRNHMEQQECILSPFWRLQVLGQGTSRALRPPRLGGLPPCLLPASRVGVHPCLQKPHHVSAAVIPRASLPGSSEPCSHATWLRSSSHICVSFVRPKAPRCQGPFHIQFSTPEAHST